MTRGRKPTPLAERLWPKVDQRGTDECWPWLGALSDGYGVIRDEAKRQRPAHRLAWIITRGPVADDLVIDHLCRNRACCNPAHMEPVTNRENLIRGWRHRRPE